MATSDDGILENIWDFILGSLRLIFFLVIFTLTLVSVIVTVLINLSLYYGHATVLEYIIINSIVIVPLMVLFLGTHGFFYKNITTLHWFSIILIVSAVLSLISGVTLFTLTESLNVGRIEDQFKKGQKDYSWFIKPTDIDSDAYVDTTFWDGLQSVFSCCGIEGPADWVAYAPKTNGSSGEMYPRSCCSRAEVEVPEAQWRLCSKDAIYQEGCRKALRFSWKSVSIVLVILAALYSVTAGISQLIIRETELEDAEVRQDAVNDAMGESISLSAY